MSEIRQKKRKVEFIESYWTGGEFGSDYQWNDNHGELVRCKDCKHRPKEPNWKTYKNGFDIEFPEGSECPCQCSSDKYYSWYPQDDWFCANGKRKDGR